jgi:hypothetical protein
VSLVPVQAYKIRCDGCGGFMPHPDDGEDLYTVEPEPWLDAWTEEGGKHYCRTQLPGFNPDGSCWPPSMRDDDEEETP